MQSLKFRVQNSLTSQQVNNRLRKHEHSAKDSQEQGIRIFPKYFKYMGNWDRSPQV